MTAVTPKTLRYRLLHVPAALERGHRRRRLKSPQNLALGRAVRRAADRQPPQPHHCPLARLPHDPYPHIHF